MEEALLAKLIASAGVGALIADRINWLERPQPESLPAVTMTRVSGSREYVMGGPIGYAEARVQVDCWAETYLAAKQIGRAVITALHGERFTQGAIVFKGIFVDAQRDFSEDAEGRTVFRTTLDLMVHYTEA